MPKNMEFLSTDSNEEKGLGGSVDSVEHYLNSD